MRPKQEAFDAIKTVFGGQGDTGFAGSVKEDDCYCAIGALGFAEYGDAYARSWYDITSPFGIWHWDLIGAHDRAIERADSQGMEGVVYNDTNGRRALIDTPAYDHVMESIFEVLA